MYASHTWSGAHRREGTEKKESRQKSSKWLIHNIKPDTNSLTFTHIHTHLHIYFIFLLWLCHCTEREKKKMNCFAINQFIEYTIGLVEFVCKVWEKATGERGQMEIYPHKLLSWSQSMELIHNVLAFECSFHPQASARAHTHTMHRNTFGFYYYDVTLIILCELNWIDVRKWRTNE